MGNRERESPEEVVKSMCQRTHSGFSIDNSVRIEADDQVGLQRLIEYIVRCPFSLARMIKSVDKVAPLECPNCEGKMNIISFIE